jgi:4-hydroxy-4-methyl-2-oxoglutarate aldolase
VGIDPNAEETMAKLTEQQMLDKLHDYDTPSVCNVVATYPGRSFCLALFNPWTTNWYTDDSVRCIFPELGRTVGYAVTCVYGPPDPGFEGLSYMDVIDVMEASKKPSVLVVEQRFPPEIAGKVGLMGANMVSAAMAVGCAGAVTNGPSRDLDEVREMGFQYMMSGATAGHGQQVLHAIGVPVTVAGMDVSPGELIHMDVNGACKFPPDKLEAVLENLEKLIEEEDRRISALKMAKSAAEVRAIFKGQVYGKK